MSGDRPDFIGKSGNSPLEEVTMFRRITVVLMIPFFIFFCVQTDAFGAQASKKESCATLYIDIEKMQNEYSERLKTGGTGAGAFVALFGIFGGGALSQYAHNVEVEKINKLRNRAKGKGCKLPPEFVAPIPPSYEDLEKEMSPD